MPAKSVKNLIYRKRNILLCLCSLDYHYCWSMKSNRNRKMKTKRIEKRYFNFGSLISCSNRFLHFDTVHGHFREIRNFSSAGENSGRRAIDIVRDDAHFFILLNFPMRKFVSILHDKYSILRKRISTDRYHGMKTTYRYPAHPRYLVWVV